MGIAEKRDFLTFKKFWTSQQTEPGSFMMSNFRFWGSRYA